MMPEKILSQDEVEALLGAMKESDIDIGNDHSIDSNVKTIDLISKNSAENIQFTVLDEIFNRFIEISEHSLSNFLQKEISIEYVATEVVKFKEFMASYSRPSIFNFFTMDPLLGKAIMAIKPQIVMSLIDCMMGGDGKPVDKVNDFTRLEDRLINKFSNKFLSEFERSWKNIFPITINFLKVENNPEYIHILSQSDNVVIIDFLIKGTKFEGHINFCISYLMLEPVKEKLSETYLRGKEQDPKQRLRIKKLVKETEVDIVAELGKSKKTIHELLNLKVNDILKIQTGPDDSVTIKVCGIPKYLGDPGVIKGNRAVEISQKLK